MLLSERAPAETIATRDITVTIPDAPLLALVRAEIASGKTAEEATDITLAPYRDLPITAWARPAVLSAAHTAARNMVRPVERRVFNPVATDEAALRQAVAARLARCTFRVKGETVEWGQATVAQHKLRILVLERIAAGVMETIRQHRVAIALIEKHSAACLDDVPGWETEVGQPDIVAGRAADSVDPEDEADMVATTAD